MFKESKFVPSEGGSQQDRELESEQEIEGEKVCLEALKSHLAEAGDPIKVAREFIEVYNLRPEKYEEIAEIIEDKCLEKLPLIENYQFMLRGDCLDFSTIEAYKKQKLAVLSAVRNARRHFVKSQKDIVLGMLLSELFGRMETAYRYEYKNDKEMFGEVESRQLQEQKKREGYDILPVIMYGFREFDPKTEKLEKLKDDHLDNYFFGHGDDIGANFRNIDFITLPQTMEWKNKKGWAESVQRQEFFPTIPFSAFAVDWKERYDIDEKVHEAISKRIEQGLYGPSAVYSLSHPKSYFNSLLVVHKILADIEKFDKDKAIKENKTE